MIRLPRAMPQAVITRGFWRGQLAHVHRLIEGGATLALPGCLLNLPEGWFEILPEAK